MRKRLTLILLALATVLTMSLIGPGVARAAQLLPDQADADGNGSSDAVVREAPHTADTGWDIGANCVVDVYTKDIMIRPPAVRPLWSLGSESVAWRPVIYNATTAQKLYGAWTLATAYASGWVAPGVSDYSAYWSGSQTISVGSLSGSWYPLVEVAWWNPWTQTWSKDLYLQARQVQLTLNDSDGAWHYHYQDYAC